MPKTAKLKGVKFL